jgi:hypothetical protein
MAAAPATPRSPPGRWATAGWAGAGGPGSWVGPSGSAQLDRFFFLFFSEIFSRNIRKIQKYLDKSIKPRKISEKSQKFQENP